MLLSICSKVTSTKKMTLERRAPCHQLMAYQIQDLWTKVVACGEYSNWQFLGQQQGTKPEDFTTCTTASGNTADIVIPYEGAQATFPTGATVYFSCS